MKKVKITTEPKKIQSSPVSSPAVSDISSRASDPSTGEIADLADFSIPMGEDTEILENETQACFQEPYVKYTVRNLKVYGLLPNYTDFWLKLYAMQKYTVFSRKLHDLRKGRIHLAIGRLLYANDRIFCAETVYFPGPFTFKDRVISRAVYFSISEAKTFENWKKFSFDLKAATHGMDKALHKRVMANEKFRCMMKSCKHHSPFRNMLDHLRKLHSDIYVLYRLKMMEKYGIMEMQCPDCKFQFLTTYSYEHHKKNKRCHVYKGKQGSAESGPARLTRAEKSVVAYSLEVWT